MTDDHLLRDFESLALQPGTFGHPEHVRVAFAYLRRHGLWDALGRVRDGLRAFATAAGAPEKYHETVTCALVFLIHERMADGPDLTRWDDFAAANPDLLEWKDGPFFARYPGEVMASPVARRTFVLPPAPAGVTAP